MLDGRRVAVTGASGFVGGRLVRALVVRGALVHGFGRRRDHSLPGAHYSDWDIEGGPLNSPPPVDALVHCAGKVTDWGESRLFARCHVDGTAHVLASFPEPVPVVHVSTASVYDQRPGTEAIDEDAPLARRHLTPYSQSKILAEQLVAERRHHVILRPHAIYGPGDTVLLPRLLAAYRHGRMIVPGHGRNHVSLTHVDNLVDAIVLALEALLGDARDHRSGVFNITDAEPVLMDAALRAMLAGAGRHPRIVYLPRVVAYPLGALAEYLHSARARAGEPRITRYRVALMADDCILDLGRARRLLGYSPHRNVFGFIDTGGLRQGAD